MAIIDKRAGYAHRPRSDGFLDSICLECFQTVARSKTSPHIEQAESQHRCLGVGSYATPPLGDLDLWGLRKVSENDSEE